MTFAVCVHFKHLVWMSQNNFAGELWHKNMYLRNKVRLLVTVHMSCCIYTHSVLCCVLQSQRVTVKYRTDQMDMISWNSNCIHCSCVAWRPGLSLGVRWKLCISISIALAVHRKSNACLKYHVPTKFNSLCGYLNNQLLHVVWPFTFVWWCYDSSFSWKSQDRETKKWFLIVNSCIMLGEW